MGKKKKRSVINLKNHENDNRRLSNKVKKSKINISRKLILTFEVGVSSEILYIVKAKYLFHPSEISFSAEVDANIILFTHVIKLYFSLCELFSTSIKE